MDTISRDALVTSILSVAILVTFIVGGKLMGLNFVQCLHASVALFALVLVGWVLIERFESKGKTASS